jgi:hypothetical protein
MNGARRQRLYLTGLAMLVEVAHLTWEHLHGGVVSHHLLNRSDMPAISNWWGIVLVPALTWFLIGRIQARLSVRSAPEDRAPRLRASVVAGFAGSLLSGILLSVFFTSHNKSATVLVFEGILLCALLLRVYRAEYVLGFVLGMSFTFGAVLPTIISCVIAAVSAFIHLLIRPGAVRISKSLKRAPTPPV